MKKFTILCFWIAASCSSFCEEPNPEAFPEDEIVGIEEEEGEEEEVVIFEEEEDAEDVF